MSTKTSFKRIALALVVALGFGALSVSPSTAVIDEVLTLGTPSATTVNIGESVTVSIDLSFVSESALESRSVVMTQTGSGFTATTLIPLAADSSNVANHSNALTPANATNWGYSEVSATAGDSIVATSIFTATRAKWTLRLSNATTAGTYTYVISTRKDAGANAGSANPGTIGKSASFSVTVTAADTTGTAARTLTYLNQGTTASNVAIRNNGLGYFSADSTLVVNAGTAASPQVVGYMFVEPRNASDTRTSTAGTAVTASVVLNVSGPGLLSIDAGTTKAKSVTASRTDTVTVYSDGTAGTGTITGSIGGTFLTQAAKTITFVGIADTFIPTVESSTVVRGSTAAGAITFVAKDSAGNAIDNVNTQYRTGHPAGFYIFAADTKVVGGTTWTSVDRGAGSTAAYGTCSYSATRAKWVCDVPITDSGVATTIYIGDSYTATSSVKKSEALTLTVAGTGNTGTISFGGTSFNTGAKAIITVTSKDGDGRNVANGPSTPFSGLRWGSLAPTFGAPTGSDATGGDASGGLTTYLASASASSYVNGVDTLVVYMPTVTGTYTLIGVTGTDTREVTLASFTVVDPAQVANAAAIAAAQAASDAATDAANEAIDAANAATDAANIAAEAADAATVAAEEARDAADAATAAVEELATQVATLMAALSAQVKTLANTVAKIAKKVKA